MAKTAKRALPRTQFVSVESFVRAPEATEGKTRIRPRRGEGGALGKPPKAAVRSRPDQAPRANEPGAHRSTLPIFIPPEMPTTVNGAKKAIEAMSKWQGSFAEVDSDD